LKAIARDEGKHHSLKKGNVPINRKNVNISCDELWNLCRRPVLNVSAITRNSKLLAVFMKEFEMFSKISIVAAGAMFLLGAAPLSGIGTAAFAMAPLQGASAGQTGMSGDLPGTEAVMDSVARAATAIAATIIAVPIMKRLGGPCH
jgi:hypothetical protein